MLAFFVTKRSENPAARREKVIYAVICLWLIAVIASPHSARSETNKITTHRVLGEAHLVCTRCLSRSVRSPVFSKKHTHRGRSTKIHHLLRLRLLLVGVLLRLLLALDVEADALEVSHRFLLFRLGRVAQKSLELFEFDGMHTL